MKRFSFSLTVCVLMAGAARAEPFELACVRGEDTRKIEVLEPGSVGRACDVRYTRDSGSTISVPYHANNDLAFCSQKARELAVSLASSGYDCTTDNGVSIGAAPTLRAAPVVTAAILPQTVDSTNADISIETNTQIEDTPVNDSAVIADDRPSEETLSDQLDEILTPGTPSERELATESVVEAQTVEAVRTPIALADEVRNTNDRTPLTRIGAPDEQPQSPSKTVTEINQTPLRSSGAEGSQTAKLRPVQDIIRATLSAQQAAWNEGNLEEFMETYWKSDDLRFVSGTEVSKGWSKTLRRYRERYGDGRSLGRLRFQDLDVELVRHDVAVVIGRFELTRDQSFDSGLFTLVMKQIDGAWRIVHDHTVADPKDDPKVEE